MAPRTKIKKPVIRIARTDRDRLWRLAEDHAERIPDVADELLAELERADIVPEGPVRDFVQMGSSVRFTSDAGDDRSVTLVFPGEADIAKNMVSILTPIGVALIGMSAGQSIAWTARDGRRHHLTVVSVDPISIKAGAGSRA